MNLLRLVDDRSFKRWTRHVWSNKLRIGISALSLFGLFRFVLAYEYRLRTSYTDTAGFLELIDQSSFSRPLSGDYFRSARGLVPLITTSPEKICSVIPYVNFGNPSFFDIHPYLIATPMSALSWLLPFNTAFIAALWLSASVFLGLTTIFVFLKQLRVSVFTRICFMAALLIYPVLAQSLLGQAYFDRLMFGPGVLLVVLIWWSKNKSLKVWKGICVSGICLSLISERGAALASLTMIGYLVLLHGTASFRVRELRRVLFIGFASLTYLIVWNFRWQSYGAYSSISLSLVKSRISNLFSEALFPALSAFIIVSIGFILLAMFSGRTFIVLVLSMSPNLLLSVGGAELTGFFTHYHQTYLPMMIAASAIGIFAVEHRLQSFSQVSLARKLRLTIGPMLLAVTFMSSTSQVYGTDASDLQQLRDTWLIRQNSLNYLKHQSDELQTVSDYVARLKEGTVSAPEGMMPALLLSGVRDVEYWPMGVGEAEILVVPVDENGPNPYPVGFWGDTETLRQCLKIEISGKYRELKAFEEASIKVFKIDRLKLLP